MGLSTDIISQFAKVVNSDKKTEKESVVYGQTIMHNGEMFVKLDGSNILTPVSSTTELKQNERVMVTIKNHSATVTGNVTSPAAQHKDVQKITSTMSEVEDIFAHTITTDELDVINATIDNLIAKTGSFTELEAVTAELETLKANYATVTKLTTNDIEVINANIENIKSKVGEFESLSTEDLDVINAEIDNLKAHNADFSYISAEVLTALKGYIDDLDTKKLSAEEADLKYVNIERSNIDKAWIEALYAQSGLIQYLQAEDGTFTGRLVGVTIKGDLIEGNTIVADKLVIQGDDGLYYKLNTSVYDVVCYKCALVIDGASFTFNYVVTDEILDGVDGTLMPDVTTTDGDAVYFTIINDELVYFCKTFVYNNEKIDIQEVPKSGLDGKIIVAESITADKIDVSDLNALNATIGGFNIGDRAIYSGVKDSVDNTTRGIYQDKDGQFALGDSNNYIRFRKTTDENGNEIYKLDIAADSILFGTNTKASIADLKALTEHVKIEPYVDPDTGDVKPSVQLAEGDTDFKQVITNTKTMFMDGSEIGTTIDRDGLISKNVQVEDEFRLAEFVWSRRASGNCGIMWKEMSN